MNGYIIHLPNSELSVNQSNKTADDLKTIGINPILFEGCTKDDAWQEFINLDFKINNIKRFGGGNVDSELGTFISHYRLWERCFREGKNIIIFEHDASLIKPFDIKELKSFDGDVLNLGKPNWGNRVWEGVGLYKRNINNLKTETDWEKEKWYSESNEDWLFGAHAYLVTPIGAKKLIDSANKNGILPADVMIRLDVVSISDLLPHPFEQRKNISFIQRKTLDN